MFGSDNKEIVRQLSQYPTFAECTQDDLAALVQAGARLLASVQLVAGAGGRPVRRVLHPHGRHRAGVPGPARDRHDGPG